MTTEVYFLVEGVVQGVMFRQTLIRAAQRRGLRGAATNLSDGRVSACLGGARESIDEILAALRSGMQLNSWGARVARLELIDAADGIGFDNHQVSTENVDRFAWSANVEMYL